MLHAMNSSALDTFRAFRNSLYNCLHRRADALFELTDAFLTAEAEPKKLWLWWDGPGEEEPDLDLLWRAYIRRFDLEHTFRFLKQTLGWTTPRVRHPEQDDRGRRGWW